TQRFVLEGADLVNILKGATEGTQIKIDGGWHTAEKSGKSIEAVTAKSAKIQTASVQRLTPFQGWISTDPHIIKNGSVGSFAPIRTTSPGLTVYKGGAITTRFSYTNQHLGNLKAQRYDVLIEASYTPTSHLQLEAELPIEHISTRAAGFATTPNAAQSRVGNLALAGKYRFYRKVGEWGDRQAAVRFGVELPTGQSQTPFVPDPGTPLFVQQQLSAINNGFAAHSELAYSHAKGRLIYGVELAGMLRGERNGYRLGHEVRANTDLEYVILPIKYQHPGHELFALLESSLVHRGRGHLNGQPVTGSDQTVYYLSPGLQFTVSPRVVIESSYEIPVVRTNSPLALRTDRSLLVGLRLLY